MIRAGFTAATLALGMAACADESAPTPPAQTEFGGDRPVTLQVPPDYDHATPTPLVVILHGASATGAIQQDYIGFDRFVSERGALLLAPDGTDNDAGVSYWDVDGTDVDDAGYIVSLIDDVAGVYNVDAARVHLFGHSNGATLAYVLACTHSERIASILPLAHGPKRAHACAPTTPVSVMHVHGDADTVVPYDGFQGFRGAIESVELLAAANDCGTTRERLPPVDLDVSVPDAETEVARTVDCPPGIDVELWTLRGGGHVPDLAESFADTAWSFYESHPKP